MLILMVLGGAALVVGLIWTWLDYSEDHMTINGPLAAGILAVIGAALTAASWLAFRGDFRAVTELLAQVLSHDDVGPNGSPFSASLPTQK